MSITNRKTEIAVGFFIILVIISAISLITLFSTKRINNNETYSLQANFDDIGNLKNRSSVKIAGVKVGQVSEIKLHDYRASVKIDIYKSQKIPTDSQARIMTEGLLGANFISITPGMEQDMLQNNDKIEQTTSAMILEDLIGQLLFKFSG